MALPAKGTAASKHWILPGNSVQSRATVIYLPGAKVLTTHETQVAIKLSGIILGLDTNLHNLFSLCLCFLAPGTFLTISDIKPDLDLTIPNTPNDKLIAWVFLKSGNIFLIQLSIEFVLNEDKQNHQP